MPDEPAPPTAEDIQKGHQVVEAGAEAHEKGQDPARAMKQERDRNQLDLPDEIIDKMAAAISEKNIQALEQRGAFDTPPEPVRPPEHAEHAPPQPSEAQHRDEPAQQADQPPRPRSDGTGRKGS